MSRPVARLTAGLLVSALLSGGSTTLAAEPTPADVLVSSYALWGMMDAAAQFCWEVGDYAVAYMEAHQNWLARNVVIRDELDAARIAAGAPDNLAADGEAAGAKGISDIFAQATNKQEVCATWLAETDGLGRFEPETFLSHQLGILRERDGM